VFIYLKKSAHDFPAMSEEQAKSLAEQIKKQLDDHKNKPTMAQKRKRADFHITLVVVGNENSGKTAFLKKLLGPPREGEEPEKEEFNRLLPIRMRKDNIIIDFVDTSCAESLEEELKENILKADFIFIVYDFTLSEGSKSVSKKWLPYIKKTVKRTKRAMPKIAIIANKCDSEEADLQPKEQEYLKNLDENVAFVAVCSCISGRNLDQSFEIAHLMIMNPIEPLVCNAGKELTPKFIGVLTEIFEYFDRDSDGVLSDHEIKHLSQIVWNEPLANDTLLNIKDVLFKESELNILNEGVSLKGFCALMHKYIIAGRRDIPWDMIRDFGFDNDLNYTLVSHIKNEEQAAKEAFENEQLNKLKRNTEGQLLDNPKQKLIVKTDEVEIKEEIDEI